VTPLLAKKYPRLRIVYREQMTELVVADLASGDLDCGIVALEADLGDLAHAVLFTDPFVVALPKHHPLARKKRLHLHDLDSARVLLLEDGHCFRTQALALCAKTSAREAEFRATSLGTLVQMVTSSFAITLLPALALKVENRRAQLEIRPIIAPIPKRTIALVWRRTSPLSAALKEIAAAIHSAVA
jgi:LysR family hydrogen peroxide-inducible transcriptional activator